MAPVTESSHATSRNPAGLSEFTVAGRALEDSIIRLLWQPGTLSGSRVDHWFLGHERGVSHECGNQQIQIWLEVGECWRTVIRGPESLGYSQLTAHLLPYEKKRVQKPMLVLSPSTYQLNTSFKQKGTQTSLTFSKIALIQQICCNPEDRCITTMKDFVMNVLITVCYG